jgi:hypothetical protein
MVSLIHIAMINTRGIYHPVSTYTFSFPSSTPINITLRSTIKPQLREI